MKINWNFGRGGGGKQKTFCGGSMDSFWNCTLIFNSKAARAAKEDGKMFLIEGL